MRLGFRGNIRSREHSPLFLLALRVLPLFSNIRQFDIVNVLWSARPRPRSRLERLLLRQSTRGMVVSLRASFIPLVSMFLYLYKRDEEKIKEKSGPCSSVCVCIVGIGWGERRYIKDP